MTGQTAIVPSSLEDVFTIVYHRVNPKAFLSTVTG